VSKRATEEITMSEVEQLRARIAELETLKLAYEQTPKQWSTAQAPTMESVAHTARCLSAERTSTALLANLKFAVWCIENPGHGPTPDALANMKTAIAQAEANLKH
jgi:hypothetical protein